MTSWLRPLLRACIDRQHHRGVGELSIIYGEGVVWCEAEAAEGQKDRRVAWDDQPLTACVRPVCWHKYIGNLGYIGI
jgi:hypothetical protein